MTCEVDVDHQRPDSQVTASYLVNTTFVPLCLTLTAYIRAGQSFKQFPDQQAV